MYCRRNGYLLLMHIKVTMQAIFFFLCILVVLSWDAEACGWWGDGNYDDNDDVILVGDDGKPVPDEEISQIDPAEQTRIGNRFREGQGVAKNYVEAAYWYRKAAEQGFAGAQNNLAGMYEQGLGVAKDESEAAKWYRRAAEQGDGHAQHSLGSMYRDGRGVQSDCVKAAAWIRKAAEQGHQGALRDMGQLYWTGTGVAQSNVLAYTWFKLAALTGDEEATRLLSVVAEKMTPIEISEAETMVRERTGKNK